MELSYCGPEIFSDDKYHYFVAEFHGEAAAHHLKRTRWYMAHFDFRILLAYVDGELAGQSCAYKTSAVINGVQKDLWWSVDTFVLSKYRGLGLGKKLQAKLHEDCVNFSSLWYSKTNGAIKKKLGAMRLLSTKLNYYPINALARIVSAALRKKKSIGRHHLISNKYLFFHRLCPHKRFTEKRLSVSEFLDLAPEIKQYLAANYDFYVDRDKEYLKTKYIDNPSVAGYEIIGLYNKKQEILSAVYILSKPYVHQTVSVYLNVCSILDSFIFDKNVREKDIVRSAVVNAAANSNVDGLIAFGEPQGLLRLTYPLRGLDLLSTMHPDKQISQPYISFMDQDMEQMLP